MKLLAAAIGLGLGLFLADGVTPLFRSLEEVPLRPGLPVVLVFFSTACPACWDDLFEVRSMIEENGLELELIGVTKDPERSIRAFLDKYGFPGPIIRDERKRLYRDYRVEIEPAAVVIEHGRVTYKDDAYRDYPSRREELKKWMMRRAGRSMSA